MDEEDKIRAEEKRMSDIEGRLSSLEKDVSGLIGLKNKGITAISFLVLYIIKDPAIKFWDSIK